MSRQFTPLLVGLALAACTAGAPAEVLDRQLHEHALAVIGTTSFAVARGSSIEIWSAERLSGPARILSGHSGQVVALAMSPDGEHLASSDDRSAVMVWNLDTYAALNWTNPVSGETFHQLRGHSFTVWALGFSPDGRTLATGAHDHTVRLWDVRSGREIGVLEGHGSWIRSVAFSPDGRLLASSSCDGTVRLWDVSTLRFVRHLREGSDNRVGNNVYNVAFSPDGGLLAVVTNASRGGQGMVQVYRSDTWTKLWEQQPPGSGSAAYALAFSPDGTALASGGFARKVELRDALSGQLLQELTGHTDQIWGLAFFPGGTRLISTGKDGTARLWPIEP